MARWHSTEYYWWPKSGPLANRGLNNTLNKIFLVKIKIFEFYTLNRAWYPIYDETMQSRSLLEGKTTEIKQCLKLIILTTKMQIKTLRFFCTKYNKA